MKYSCSVFITTSSKDTMPALWQYVIIAYGVIGDNQFGLWLEPWRPWAPVHFRDEASWMTLDQSLSPTKETMATHIPKTLARKLQDLSRQFPGISMDLKAQKRKGKGRGKGKARTTICRHLIYGSTVWLNASWLISFISDTLQIMLDYSSHNSQPK